MPGTGFPAARLLLVEQYGAWGHAGLPTSRFDSAVAAELITRAGREGVRVLTIRRPGRTPRRARRHWFTVDTRPGRRAVHRGTYDQDAALRELPFDGSAGEPVDDLPLWLVCTHGKHDPCCALRGRPVAAALDAERPGQVWECSHLGGERFAANVLTLPDGLLHGRVLSFAAPGFVASTEAGELVVPLLRGRIGYPATVQAAMVHAYGELALTGVDSLQAVSARGTGPNGTAVRLAVTGPDRDGVAQIDVHLAVERLEADHLTCTRPGPGAYLSYRPVRIAAVR